jgi:hypothetical protein
VLYRLAALGGGILALGLGALPAAPSHGQEAASAEAPEIPAPAFTAVSVLKPAGPISLHAPGLIARGETIVSLPVTHGLTGSLSRDVQKLGLFSKDSIPSGSPVFGIPMTGSRGPGIVWCAPRSEARGDKKVWNTVCFPQGRFTLELWLPVYTPLFPTYLSYSANSTHGATEVLVERKAVDLPTMQLNFTFTEWDKDDADVFVSVDAPNAKNPVGNRSLPRLPDGSVRLKAFGGEFKLTQVGADRRTAMLEIITPPHPEAVPEF